VTTGAYWDVTNPLKPFGLFDFEGVYDIPFDWVTWLAGLTDTYASHVITVDPALTVVSSANVGGVITVRIKKAVAATLVEGTKYGITCQITTTNGQVEEQTLFLKAREK